MPDSWGAWLWWWFSVVFVGLLINIASRYIIPIVDNYVGKYSNTQHIKNLQQRQRVEGLIKAMVSDSNFATMVSGRVIRYGIISGVNYAISLMILFLFVLMVFSDSLRKSMGLGGLVVIIILATTAGIWSMLSVYAMDSLVRDERRALWAYEEEILHKEKLRSAEQPNTLVTEINERKAME